MKTVIFVKDNSIVPNKTNATSKLHKMASAPIIKNAGTTNVNVIKVSKSVYDSNRVVAYQSLVS